MIELFHWEPNDNSSRAILAFKGKLVEFNSNYMDLQKFEQHSHEYWAINPRGQVPVMIHNGLVLTESAAILEYICEGL